jgi:hypothetical protein
VRAGTEIWARIAAGRPAPAPRPVAGRNSPAETGRQGHSRQPG